MYFGITRREGLEGVIKASFSVLAFNACNTLFVLHIEEPGVLYPLRLIVAPVRAESSAGRWADGVPPEVTCSVIILAVASSFTFSCILISPFLTGFWTYSQRNRNYRTYALADK